MDCAEHSNRTECIVRTTRLGLACNLGLSIAKLLGGFFGRSSALLADGLNSTADIVTDLVALWGMKMVTLPEDQNHRYGHGKFETLATTAIGVALILLSLSMLIGAVSQMIQILSGAPFERPNRWVLIIALVTVGLKQFLFRRTLAVAQDTDSDLLLGKAWDHRSDVFASSGVMAGVAASLWFDRWGALCDPLAASLVSLMVARVGVLILWRSLAELSELAPEALGQKIKNCILSVSGVMELHNLRYRRLGSYYAMDFDIVVSPQLSLREAHQIASLVEEALRHLYGDSTLITVHVEPADEENSVKDATNS